ncbi:MAG: T7SS effector LXG polymorphic toxin [Hespellia sp.]|nr:T7SS effector LXG polymorphic toxin [Hespellia sp.]
MGYEIKYEDIRNLRTMIIANCSGWQQEIQNLQSSFIGLGTSIGMQGETAASIGAYAMETHCLIINNIVKLLAEFVAKISVYEQGYLEIDSDSNAHITQDVLETKMQDFQSRQSEFEEMHEAIRGVLDSVSDICQISRPMNGSIETNFFKIPNDIRQLNEKVGTYENAHLSDCESVREYIQAVQSFISGQSGKGQVIISSYKVGSVYMDPSVQKLSECAEATSTYLGANQEDVDAVAARMKAEIKEEIKKAIAEQKKYAVWEIVNGVVAIAGVVVGVAVIGITGGAATPFIAGLLSIGGATVTMYGASNIYEGGDAYHLADAGKLTSVARNPIRDSVFGGNQTAYDVWGNIGSIMFAAGGMAQTAATINSSGASHVGNLAEHAKGASGAGNPVDDIINGVEKGDIKLTNNMQKGNYGEMKMDSYFEQQGYKRVSLDKVTDINAPTHKGIDGVYHNPNGKPPYVIGEAKYGSSTLGNTRDGLQMSDTWIKGSDRLVNSVGKDLADDIFLEGFGKTVVRIKPDGTIIPKVLK